MEATELRIGNFVLISTEDELVKIPSTPKKIYGINIRGELEFARLPDRKSNFIVPVKHCNGIPLGEEWLNKFGFDISWHHGCGYRATLENFELCCGDAWECYHYVIVNERTWENKIPVEITYIHQLQNLYFVLTGKELELKTF